MAKIPKVILLLVTSREYDRVLLRGIAKYSRLHGPWTFFREPLFYLKAGQDKTLLSRLKQRDADGIIMREPEKNDDIMSLGLPTIVSPYSKEKIPGLPNIVSDHIAMADMAARHLLDRGFQNFAYCGFGNMSFSVTRGRCFQKSIEKAGFKVHFYDQPKAETQQLWENEQIIMADWLKSLPKPIGLMTCNDDRSQYVIEACTIAGLQVPDEVAVIGVDNDDLVCELSNPPLSSVALNVELAGFEAAELLDKLMSGKEKITGQEIKVEPTYVATRQSTDILAIDDPEVSTALRFIRQHAKENIFVADVVEAVTISRRSLQERFQKVLHRSVQDEIARVRAEMVAQLLVETNLSISEICVRLNYGGPEHISRSFKRAKGVSPRVFRSRYGQK